MVLESTMICVDNSDYMRNGDFAPTRLQAQSDAVSLVCHAKTRANPENNVGVLTMANRIEVLATLTSDAGRVISKLHLIKPVGAINFPTGLRIAHLALKHRQGRNHKMRIVVFVGSPLGNDEKELIKLAKRLKKEKVNVDIISFGEDNKNDSALTSFISTINGKEGTASHFLSIPPGPILADALLTSPIIMGEDGTGGANLGGVGFEFGVDPNEDPELALALRVSMEEQRHRQESAARRTNPAPVASAPRSEEDLMLERALAMSMETEAGPSSSAAATDSSVVPDINAMTEDEQFQLALRMSMVEQAQESSSGEEKTDKPKEEAMEVEDSTSDTANTAFLKSVLEGLPGVENESSEAGSSSKEKKNKTDDEKDKDTEEK